VLVVATDGETRGRVHQRLEEEFEVVLVKTFEAGLEQLQGRRFALALLDVRDGGRQAAELARRLAVKKGMKGDEVFTCALLYDLGRLVMHVGLPENTVHHIHDLELHKGRAKAEELVVGFNYAQVGAAMARYWKFPETISNAVEYHYNPMLAKEFSPEAGLIHLAIVLAAQSDVGEEAPPEWPHKVADALGLSWADCAAQFTALREQGNGYAGLLAA
jgi:HD-like signal output (HDOD) protein